MIVNVSVKKLAGEFIRKSPLHEVKVKLTLHVIA